MWSARRGGSDGPVWIVVLAVLSARRLCGGGEGLAGVMMPVLASVFSVRCCGVTIHRPRIITVRAAHHLSTAPGASECQLFRRCQCFPAGGTRSCAHASFGSQCGPS